ncbi:MAG: hypothetical protein KGL39_47245 [Patescibacteria group bacterium]|nr:hypothetical protein [Patescibacteria group bacterium]
MKLPHAEVIKHMIEHGYESVEWHHPDSKWLPASAHCNPFNLGEFPWRIKPDTVTVEIPRPTDVSSNVGAGSTNPQDARAWGFSLFYADRSQAETARANIKKAMGL